MSNIDQAHERLMRDDPDYRTGFEFMRQNRRHYDRLSPAEIKGIAERMAECWNPNDAQPYSFSLGAAAYLLRLARVKEAAA